MTTPNLLKEQMEKSKNRPLPSAKKIRKQWEAMEKFRHEQGFNESRSFKRLLIQDSQGRMVMR